MDEAKAGSPNAGGNFILGLLFVFGGALWLAIALFFANDAIDDWLEAHSPEVSGVPGPTWWEGFQQSGGIGGALGFAPPTILLVYGFYLLGRTLHRCLKKTKAPNPR